jgi:uncharacterized protein (TIGR04442 family)
MIGDLRLHGSLGFIEFFVHISGPEAKNTYFFEETGDSVRFFSRGNEFALDPLSVRYRGTGGSFCEYMFGVEKSLKDLVKKDILNRLVMFGAYLDRAERLLFTNDTSGTDSYEKIFLQGHAVKNYFFFVSSGPAAAAEEAKKRQRHLLGVLGKFLKRTPLVAEDRDSVLVEKIAKTVKEPGSTIFLLKLIHKNNRAYYEAFRDIYFKNKIMGEEEEHYLSELAGRLGVDYYQQERMKIDLMYRHPENKPIADQHRDILISAVKGPLEPSEAARLTRLKTLRIRHKIPGVLFDTLDNMLLRGKKIQELEEAHYLKEARSIMENLFFKDPSLKAHIIKEDIVRLIRAKHRAYKDGDVSFEQMLLDIGRACDETSKETGDYALLEELSSIITYFDRYDHVQASMSQLAFMQEINLTDDFLRSLIGNKAEFEELESDLFTDLFVKDLLSNKYVTNYGKRKIKAISAGMDRVVTGDAALRDIITEIRMIADEERLYWEVHRALKEKLRSFYPHLDSREGREEIRADIERELAAKGVALKVPGKFFNKAILDLKKESFYINYLLPVIIKTMDTRLREDFITNSGLDRFYIENIEKNYFEERGLDAFLLELLKEGKETTSA